MLVIVYGMDWGGMGCIVWGCMVMFGSGQYGDEAGMHGMECGADAWRCTGMGRGWDGIGCKLAGGMWDGMVLGRNGVGWGWQCGGME